MFVAHALARVYNKLVTTQRTSLPACTLRFAVRDALASSPRSMVSFADVRAKLVAELTTEEFNAAADELSQAGWLVMHHHDRPQALSAEKRAELVEVRGAFFQFCAIRPGQF